jgi:hypothetical protein
MNAVGKPGVPAHSVIRGQLRHSCQRHQVRCTFDADDATSILLTVRYFAALNFPNSYKASIYITNKNTLALGDRRG